MFNRHFELRWVKDSKPEPSTPPEEKKVVIDIPAVAKDLGKSILIGTVVLMTTSAVLTTLSTVTINILSPTKE